MNIDFFLFQKINNIAGKHLWLDTAGIFFAQYFEYFLIAGLLLFLAKNARQYWPMVWQALVASFFARFVVTEIIRFLWVRPRPFVENEVYFFLQNNSASFPSGHATFYFALSTIVYRYNKKAGALFFIASFLITFSRVFIGVHWPLDILAGAIVGILCAKLIVLLFSRRASLDIGQAPPRRP